MFSFLDSLSLARVSQVQLKWRNIARTDRLWIDLYSLKLRNLEGFFQKEQGFVFLKEDFELVVNSGLILPWWEIYRLSSQMEEKDAIFGIMNAFLFANNEQLNVRSRKETKIFD